MTFTCFGKVIENTKRFKILCLCFLILVVSVTIIAALTATLIPKKTPSHDENGEITTISATTRMTSLSTRQSISTTMMTSRITTGTSTTRPQTSSLNPLSYWTTDSYFTRPRGLFDAVVFPNGQVMACGGFINYTFVTRVCDVYTSSVNWTAATRMNSLRYYHTLTFFANKTKILAAGNNFYGDQQTAEVYNIANDTWTYTPMNMTTSRYSHSAILLKNEQILIVGGMNSSDDPLSSAELFLPSSNSFIRTNSMHVARTSFTSTLFTDGLTVLVTGGMNADIVPTASGELYISGTWTFTNNDMTESRSDHAAVLLQDGNVLIAGGSFNTSHSSATAEIYNVTTRTFTGVGSMRYPRAGFTLTLLPSGKVLATGGVDWSRGTLSNICELYDPVTQTWSDTRTLRTGRYFPVSVLLADSVLTMGGDSGGYNYLASCEKYSF